MPQKEITLLGVTYPVVFNMQSMLNYEQITGKSFFNEKFELLADRMAVVIAAIIAANPDADIKVESLVKANNLQTVQEIITAYAVVMELMGDFFKKPDVEPDDKPASEESSQKN